MSVREKTLQVYLNSLLKNSRIRDFIKQNSSKSLNNLQPQLTVVDQVSKENPSQYAGMALGHRSIQVSRWICVDKEQGLSTVRHEFAHIIKNWCELPGSYHGRGFTNALKTVSPRLWRTDRHWQKTALIERARRGINSRVWSTADTRRYYIQVDNGSKFAWRQMTFADIKAEFKKAPKKLWTRGTHCSRITVHFSCKPCKITLNPTTPGTTIASYYKTSEETGSWTNETVENYFICPACEASTAGSISLLGKQTWSGSLKAWTK